MSTTFSTLAKYCSLVCNAMWQVWQWENLPPAPGGGDGSTKKYTSRTPFSLSLSNPCRFSTKFYVEERTLEFGASFPTRSTFDVPPFPVSLIPAFSDFISPFYRTAVPNALCTLLYRTVQVLDYNTRFIEGEDLLRYCSIFQHHRHSQSYY